MDRPGRVVFIGNIPYGLTEEEIIRICTSAGQVQSFRLVYDSDTGRPKGFGFAEFADTDAAASAVRNLNKYQIMGRELRVDFSHVGGKDDAIPAGYQPEPQVPSNNAFAPSSSIASGSNGLPPLPPGVDVPPGLTCPDAISQTLSTLPTTQLLDIIKSMKGLCTEDPAKATELFNQAPQLSYAMFQALLLMGLVDTSVLSSVVEQAAQPAAAAGPAPPPPQATPQIPTTVPAHLQQRAQNQPYQPPPSHLPSSQQQVYPQPTPQPYQPYQPPPQQVHVPTPQQYQPPYQAPAPAPQPQITLSQEDLLQQVLQMPQQDIDRLGPTERAQIMEIKRQFGAVPRY
ncbi:hypothetical protein MMC14_001329 [Varicellaria rhodocarpa]|nr:hypothetical protein [Varicellaria rhodocarpa]